MIDHKKLLKVEDVLMRLHKALTRNIITNRVPRNKPPKIKEERTLDYGKINPKPDYAEIEAKAPTIDYNKVREEAKEIDLKSPRKDRRKARLLELHNKLQRENKLT